MTHKQRILFLCVANSCRSQIAEGLVRYHLGDYYDVASAGSIATFVHPRAIAVMAEIGIDISTQFSKSVDSLEGESFDQIVTVCDDAGNRCPVWLGSGNRKHLPFPDPAQATGTEEEILAVFREVRDDMKNQLLEYCENEIQRNSDKQKQR